MVLPTRTRTVRKRQSSMPRKKTGLQLFKKKASTNSNSGPGKLRGRARALSRVKNPTARAAISKSPGKTFPAGNLAKQAKANVAKMLKQGGGTSTRMKTAVTPKAVAKQRKPKR